MLTMVNKILMVKIVTKNKDVIHFQFMLKWIDIVNSQRKWLHFKKEKKKRIQIMVVSV